MFGGNLGFGELVLILMVALIVFGPQKLPEIGRAIGKALREFRNASRDIGDRMLGADDKNES